MNITTIAVSELKPAKYNPRTIDKDEFAGLVKSIETFGQQENLIVNKDMTIISGHQRLEAMKSLGITEAVCNLVDLDKRQEKKLNVIMNSQAISGRYDDIKLAEILEELKLDDDYEGLRLDKLEPLDLSNAEIDEDEAPEVSQEPPVSKLGEIYQLGKHRVMCGDSTDKANVELLMNGAKADMVFTDPPYGMELDTDYTKMGDGGKKHDAVIADDEQFDASVLLDMFDYCKDIFLWGADYYIETLGRKYPKLGSWIIWDKYSDSDRTGLLDGRFGSTFETCWSKTPHKREIARVLVTTNYTARGDESRVHPTQKPVELAGWFFKRWGRASDNIVDLYLGSGSTLIACEQTDRTCYGMELDPKYVDVIRKRYAKFIGKEESWQEATPRVDDQQ